MSSTAPLRTNRPRGGFTILEILIAIMFLAFAILSFMWLNQTSNRGSMDAYFEFLAFSLAQEPIEIYRGLGYEQVCRYLTNSDAPLPKYPLDTWIDITDDPTSDAQHPPDAAMFSRRIEMQPVTKDGLKAIKITVMVQPKGQSRVEAWLSRQRVTLDSLIMEKPL